MSQAERSAKLRASKKAADSKGWLASEAARKGKALAKKVAKMSAEEKRLHKEKVAQAVSFIDNA